MKKGIHFYFRKLASASDFIIGSNRPCWVGKYYVNIKGQKNSTKSDVTVVDNRQTVTPRNKRIAYIKSEDLMRHPARPKDSRKSPLGEKGRRRFSVQRCTPVRNVKVRHLTHQLFIRETMSGASEERGKSSTNPLPLTPPYRTGKAPLLRYQRGYPPMKVASVLTSFYLKVEGLALRVAGIFHLNIGRAYWSI